MNAEQGSGTVPRTSLLSAAKKQLFEILSSGEDTVYKSIQSTISFTADGTKPKQIADFLQISLNAGRKHEPTVETGNKYGVNDKLLHTINSELLMESFIDSRLVQSLSTTNKQRALDTLSVVFTDHEMRNRNCLHPGMIDSTIIGNLLNFPKHIFGFPFGGHGTDGNEVLSLCLYSYRVELDSKTASTKEEASGAASRSMNAPLVVFVDHLGSSASASSFSSSFTTSKSTLLNLQLCAQRICMEFQTKSLSNLILSTNHNNVAVVLINFNNPNLNKIAAKCEKLGLPVHIHITDAQWCNIFISNTDPIHYNVPTAVTSLSIEDGLLFNGYSCYRTAELRDQHLDVGYEWQTAYMSPNEGGSGSSMPLFADFCTIMLGWKCLHEITTNGGGWRRNNKKNNKKDNDNKLLCTTYVDPFIESIKDTGAGKTTSPSTQNDFDLNDVSKLMSTNDAIEWGKKYINNPKATRSNLETLLVNFQRNFIGGKDRSLEVVSTAGGTRSINLAFESVLVKCRQHANNRNETNQTNETKESTEFTEFDKIQKQSCRSMKVLTGNPHLAVERAERRFGFELIRLPHQGVLSPEQLEKHVSDLSVVAVYTQTLSYTDGITDPLFEILTIIEKENQRRLAIQQSFASANSSSNEDANDEDTSSNVHNSVHNSVHNNAPPLITLINDCCLAFSVLVHAPHQRILDLSRNCITPIIVTIDAHKHLGTDKGMSTVIGTPGTLSHLTGHIRVGGQPTTNDLIRALTSIRLVGVQQYETLYHELGLAVQKVCRIVQENGMKIIHSEHRSIGSTVVSVEDPSGYMKRKMKKKGHALASLFSVYPEDLNKCQTGWQLSLTPYSLRTVRGECALDIFLKDLACEYKKVQNNFGFQLCNTLGMKENTLIPCLLSGNVDPVLLPYLPLGGRGRSIIQFIVRRYFTAQMDCGVMNSVRVKEPVALVAKRSIMMTFFMIVLYIMRRRRRML